MGPGNNTEVKKIMYKFEVVYANGKRSENPVIGIFFPFMKIIWNSELDIKYGSG